MLDPQRWEYVRLIDRDGHSIRNDLYHKPEETASYIIWKDGDLIYAKNGHTGQIPYEDDDATTVIQAAINETYNAGGGTIYIREGTYRVGKIDYKEKVYILGAGKRATRLLAKDDLNDDIFYSSLSSPTYGGIKGLTITWGGSSGNTVGSGITAKPWRFLVEDVEIRYAPEDGIKIATSSDIRIKNVTLDRIVRYGINGEAQGDWVAEDIIIYGDNAPYYRTTAGIYSKRTCRINSIHVYGCEIGILLQDAADSNIVGGQISGNFRHGLRIQSVTEYGSAHDILVTGINFYTNGMETADTYDNLIIDGDYAAAKIVIVGCDFRHGGYARYGINLANAGDVIIVGNNLKGSGRVAAVNGYNPNLGHYARGNLGFVTVNRGTARIDSGTSSVTVNHGLSVTPQIVLVTGTNYEVRDAWIPEKTDTYFTIYVQSNVTANRYVHWYAEA